MIAVCFQSSRLKSTGTRESLIDLISFCMLSLAESITGIYSGYSEYDIPNESHLLDKWPFLELMCMSRLYQRSTSMSSERKTFPMHIVALGPSDLTTLLPIRLAQETCALSARPSTVGRS